MNLFVCEKINTGDDNHEESNDAPSFNTESDSDESGKVEANITPTLSVDAMTGISQPQTLKLFVHIKNMKVTVLIDSGSTHNFIDSRVAKQLNIFIYHTASFQVSIPRNKTTLCHDKFHKVELSINNYKLKLPMYAMEIRGFDIGLGAQWLETLGIVGLNLSEQFINFYENGRKYKLYSINSPPLPPQKNCFIQ